MYSSTLANRFTFRPLPASAAAGFSLLYRRPYPQQLRGKQLRRVSLKCYTKQDNYFLKIMSTYIQQVNPAAILGYSLPFITLLDTTAPAFQFHAGRSSMSAGRMYTQMTIADPALLQALEAMPEFASLEKRSYVTASGNTSVIFKALPYAQLLALMGGLASLGIKFDTELANQQAKLTQSGVPLDARAAYDHFVQDATAFLNQVQSLNLPELASRKGIGPVERPMRSIGLAKGPSGVYVSPDPVDPRYVQVIVRGKISGADVVKIRDLAYDHYEKLGLRVQLFG